MGAIVTQRPDWYTYASGSFNTLGGSLHSMWADNQDSSYVMFTGTGGEIGVRFQPYTLLANQRCAGVRLGLRLDSTSHGFDYSLDTWVRSGNGSFGDLNGRFYGGPNAGFYNDNNGWYNAEFSQHQLNDIRGHFRNNAGGVTTASIAEAYLDLDIRTKPTVSVTGPGAHNSTGHSLTPTVTWNANYQGDAAAHYIVHIRRVSDGVLVHDSGWQNGAPGQYAIPAGILQPGVQYAAILNVSTNFNGTAWWSDWTPWHHFTTDPLPVTTVTLPNAPVADTNRPTITWTYTTSNHPQSEWHYKVFTADETTQPGFNPDTWIPITQESGAGAVLSRQVPIPLTPNIDLKAFSRVRSSVSGWSNWSIPGPTFKVTASGLDKPARVFFAYSGGYNQGLGYYEFDDTKREGSYTWKSAPFRDQTGGRQISIREVQLYVQTYDALSYITVTVNGTSRTVTFPIPGKHHCSLLFNERAEMLDVTVFASAATPALNEAPTIEVIRIGTKSGHQLR